RAPPRGPCRVEYEGDGVVVATLAAVADVAHAWDLLCADAANESAPPLLELFLTADQPLSADALRALVAPLLEERPSRARRLCCPAVPPDGSRTHVTFAARDSRFVALEDQLGLHPEAVRRLDLQRLSEFALERLPGGEEVYALYGRSRRIPSDERIFLFAEVRAALP